MTDQDHDVPSAYLMYSVFRASERIPGEVDRAALARDVDAALDGIEGLTVRGWYDVSGFRADADVMVWWWAPRAEDRKSTRLNSSHVAISYAVFCLKKNKRTLRP